MLKIRNFAFSPIEENTYILYDETGEAAIIDCGAFYPEEKEELRLFIENNRLKIKHLLNTHLHWDHVLGNKFISDIYEVFPEYHPLEESMPSLSDQVKKFGFNLSSEDIRGMHVEEGDVITFGNVKLDLIMISGHSPAGLCFYSKADDMIFTGDVLFQESIGRSDLWGGNGKALVTGIREKLFVLPENTVVYPGHGPSTTIGHEKKNNPYVR